MFDFLARHLHLARSAPGARELEGRDWDQMQRLADACDDQAEAVGKIYDLAGVSRPQRTPLRSPR
jgi:hypothetical protein